jgi:ZIP family zinc transporter
LATLLGFLGIAFTKKSSAKFNGFTLIAAAAAMLAASVIEIIPSALSIDRGWQDSLLWFMIGAFGFAGTKFLTSKLMTGRESLMSSLTLVTVALTLHNVPEGTASIAAASADVSTGVATALAIGLQNIPEGLSIAALTIAAGLSKSRAFLLILISVAGEVIGAGAIWLNQSYLNAEINSHLLLMVAGLMVAISLIELVPDGLKLTRQGQRKTN